MPPRCFDFGFLICCIGLCLWLRVLAPALWLRGLAPSLVVWLWPVGMSVGRWVGCLRGCMGAGATLTSGSWGWLADMTHYFVDSSAGRCKSSRVRFQWPGFVSGAICWLRCRWLWRLCSAVALFGFSLGLVAGGWLRLCPPACAWAQTQAETWTSRRESVRGNRRD